MKFMGLPLVVTQRAPRLPEGALALVLKALMDRYIAVTLRKEKRPRIEVHPGDLERLSKLAAKELGGQP